MCLCHNHEASLFSLSKILGGVKIVLAPVLGRLLFTPISPMFPFLLARVLRQFKPDIVHVHMPNVSAFWLLAFGSLRGIPVIVHWHSDVVASEYRRTLALSYRFYKPLERRILSLSSRIIVTSPNYIQGSKVLKEWKDKLQVVPLGLSDVSVSTEKNHGESRFGNRGLKLLCVGRLSYYKGHTFLLQAVSRYTECELLIAGYGEQFSTLQHEIDRLQVADRVRLLGSVTDEELNQLLLESDCVCLPSIERTEAFGVVLLEAMRAGTAVIASDVPGSGIGWVVENGVTGTLVEPANVDALINAISKLQRDSGKLRSMGFAGRKRFLEMFTIEKVVEKIDNIYSCEECTSRVYVER